MIAIQKRHSVKSWMTSDEAAMIRQRFFTEHLPPLKTANSNGDTKKLSVPKQPKLRNSSLFPATLENNPSGANSSTHSTSISPNSSTTSPSIIRETVRNSIVRQHLPSLSPRSSFLHATHTSLPRRSTRYDHVSSKINTGLFRLGSLTRGIGDTHQLAPSHRLNWDILKKELELDTQVRAQAKRIQFNTSVTYTTQLSTLSELVRSKVKAHIATVMNYGEERYKIVVLLHAFQPTQGGLHIASRCLWNTTTDNSITIRMQGVDCDILMVVFLCYTDLGAI